MSDDTTMRDDIAAAFEQTAEEPTPAPETPAVESPPAQEAAPEPTPTETSEERRARDEKGRFLKSEESARKELTGSQEAPAKPATAKPVTAPATQQTTPPPTPETRAPQSWKPAVREKWASLPPEVQTEVARREREMALALQESSEARQNYQKFRDVVSPYEMLLRSSGVDAFQGVQSLLQTAAALATQGTPGRAQVLANLVRTYLPTKADVAALDELLTPYYSGDTTARPPSQPPPQMLQRDPEVQQLLQEVRSAREQAQRQADTKAEQQYATVENLEFFEDVREEMADIIEMWGRRGVVRPAKEAYDLAVKAHPEISKVVQQREAARAAQNPNGSTARARAAASSVKPSHAAEGTAQRGPSMRDDIEAAFERLQG